MNQTDTKTFRRPFYFVIVGLMGFLLPPVILLYTVLSGQLGEQDSSFFGMIAVLWVMMLAASVPLWIECRRFQVRLTSDLVELQGWRRTKSLLLSDLQSIAHEPTKIVLKDAAGKRRMEISTIIKGAKHLEQTLQMVCEQNQSAPT